MRRPPAPKFVLTEQTRPEFEGMGSYFAYFPEPFDPGAARSMAMVEFARRLGASLVAEASGGRFIDMVSNVRLEPVSQAEAEEFRAIAAPGVDGFIEMLA